MKILGQITSGQKKQGYLDGQMLISMPTMQDPRFARTLIYICTHSTEGAMGIIVNQIAPNIDFYGLLSQLNIITDQEKKILPSRHNTIHILRGGPVETGRGFVLHSADFFIENTTLAIHNGICLTATVDILKALAVGTGPANALLALGYAGWGPGQLEAEIQSNGWLHCEADRDLVFGDEIELKYDKALKKIGIHPGTLSSEAGHA